MAERLMAAYDQKIIQCCKQMKAIDFELSLVTDCFYKGVLKSKWILNDYVRRSENKKSELLMLLDEYFRKMDYIKKQKSILV
jgi:hypothetical protein